MSRGESKDPFYRRRLDETTCIGPGVKKILTTRLGLLPCGCMGECRGHSDVEPRVGVDAASRLPKAKVPQIVPDDCLDITDDGKVIIAASPVPEPAPQTFEHPRADCEGCGDPNCPCNLIDADGFLEWWRDNNQRFEASDSFTHPIDYAAAAWNAAKASSPVVAGGESEKEHWWFSEIRPIINAIGKISVQEAMDAVEKILKESR